MLVGLLEIFPLGQQSIFVADNIGCGFGCEGMIISEEVPCAFGRVIRVHLRSWRGTAMLRIEADELRECVLRVFGLVFLVVMLGDGVFVRVKSVSQHDGVDHNCFASRDGLQHFDCRGDEMVFEKLRVLEGFGGVWGLVESDGVLNCEESMNVQMNVVGTIFNVADLGDRSDVVKWEKSLVAKLVERGELNSVPVHLWYMSGWEISQQA